MKKSGWISEFKTFIMRGNVLDMAVGVVIGSAFTAIVTSVVENLLTPIIALILGKTDFSGIVVGPFGIGTQEGGSAGGAQRTHHGRAAHRNPGPVKGKVIYGY